nr:uncharacterized protein LOC109433010 [Aedes albopictus]XP_019564933.2 uncharacterized protein LOC109433010 [Aedes albopictus]XP_029734243.1 uncharacterized protein LOC109433010 [Aedes albopictus]
MAAHDRPWQEGQRLHINDLPEEVIQVITNYLPLSDRKNLSMVSPPWDRHAFSHGNMDDIKLRIRGPGIEHRDLQSLYKTGRRFRHLSYFSGDPSGEIDFAMLMRVFTVLGPSIQSIILTNRCTLRQLKELVIKLPRLQILSVGVVLAGDESLSDFPDMQNLRELYMSSNTSFESCLMASRAAPRIRTLSLNLNARVDTIEHSLTFIGHYQQQLESLHLDAPRAGMLLNQLSLRQLHTLELSNIYCNRDARELCILFQNLPVLRVALLRFTVTNQVLDVICNNCAGLYKLRFMVEELVGNAFRLLVNLNRLRELLIDDRIKGYMILDCPPLNNVEYLSLSTNPIQSDRAGASMEQLSHLFPRLRTLQINISSRLDMNNEFLFGVGYYFSQITCLFMESASMCSNMTGDLILPLAFKHLKQLTNLQELTLSCMPLMAECGKASKANCLFINFQQLCNGDFEEPPLTNLRRLKLKNCNWVTGHLFQYVSALCPALQYLEVRRCRMIRLEDINMWRTALPNCVFHYIHTNLH